MENKTFSGKELEKALVAGELTQQGHVSLTGMVKLSTKEGHISFTQAGCEIWVDLPTEMIENAEQIGKQTCKDHSHPIMRITLDEPKSSEGKILIALLSQVTSSHVSKEQLPFLQNQPQMLAATGFQAGNFDLSRQLLGQTQFSGFPTGTSQFAPALGRKGITLAAPNGLTGSVPWSWCQDACDYCRNYGWGCWPCFICQIITSAQNVGIAQ